MEKYCSGGLFSRYLAATSIISQADPQHKSLLAQSKGFSLITAIKKATTVTF